MSAESTRQEFVMLDRRKFSKLPALLLSLLLPWLMSAVAGCAGSAARKPAMVFYPAAPDTARYQFLTRIYDSGDVHKASRFRKLIVGEEKVFPFGKPYGVTMVGDRIYVVDTQLKGVIRIDLEKHRMVLLTRAGSLAYSSPINIARDRRGLRYVADSGLNRVLVVSGGENLLRTYGDGKSFTPLDVAVGDHHVYVVDKQSQGVLVLDRTSGELVGTCDASADTSGGFAFPTNIDVAPDGSVYVTDALRARVFRFDPEGRFLGAFGQQGNLPGDFVRPKGIAIDDLGRVFVADAAFENVQVFDPEGQPLTFLGGPGFASGCMFLPAGVAVSAEGIQHFRGYTHPGVQIDQLLLVSSQFGPAHLDIYGRISNSDEFARRYPPELSYQPTGDVQEASSVRRLEDLEETQTDREAKRSDHPPGG